VIALLGGAVMLIVNQLMQFGSEIPIIADKLAQQAENLQRFITSTFDIPVEAQTEYLDDIIENTLRSGSTFITSTATGTVGFLMSALLISLYIFFIMYYRNFFKKVLYRAFAYKEHETIAAIIERVQGVIQAYIVGIFTVVIILAVLNTTGLLLMGIKYAFFFGALAGLLNILPFIGVFIGSTLPVMYAFISKDSIWYPLGVLAMFTFIQTLESSIFTPNIVGSKVSLNPFVAILTLILGGQLWGPAGMILFIPFTAIVKVICDEIPALHPLGMFLGDPKKG
jgi:predicted PurR-regulated permease PerM